MQNKTCWSFIWREFPYRLLGVIIGVWIGFSPTLWAEVEAIKPGHSVSAAISFQPGAPRYKTYRIEVPSDAFAIRLSLAESSADLDIFISNDGEIVSYDEVSTSSTSKDYNETLFLSRLYDPPLETGLYYVDVAYQWDHLPRRDGQLLRGASFKLAYEVLASKEPKSLTPGKPLASTLLPEEGMMKAFSVSVPPGSKALRVDLFDTDGDLDLLVNQGRMTFSIEEADILGNWQMSRESVILRDHIDLPLHPGLYYVVVFDQRIKDSPEDFSIIVNLSAAPADFLTEIPFLTVPEDPMERALLSTLELITEEGVSSGSLISKGGLVLTNWHVIRGPSGKPTEKIYGAVTLNPAEPPVELFQLEVVDYDEVKDIALLRATRGRYGQPLPFGYRFPYHRLGGTASPSAGQSLIIIGYPGTGGTGSRSTISVTRGIVSGFQKTFYGTILKTDAELNSGNSGGAAINASFELIGIPTGMVQDELSRMGFIHPITLLPMKWVKMIENN